MDAENLLQVVRQTVVMFRYEEGRLTVDSKFSTLLVQAKPGAVQEVQQAARAAAELLQVPPSTVMEQWAEALLTGATSNYQMYCRTSSLIRLRCQANMGHMRAYTTDPDLIIDDRFLMAVFKDEQWKRKEKRNV